MGYYGHSLVLKGTCTDQTLSDFARESCGPHDVAGLPSESIVVHLPCAMLPAHVSRVTLHAHVCHIVRRVAYGRGTTPRADCAAAACSHALSTHLTKLGQFPACTRFATFISVDRVTNRFIDRLRRLHPAVPAWPSRTADVAPEAVARKIELVAKACVESGT